MAVTVTLGVAVWVGKLIVGIRAHGVKFAGIFLPGGLPLGMIPPLVAIEIISFLMTLISLPVRLFANMMSGHILLKVLAGFAWSMMASGGILFIAHFIPLAVLFLLMFLETGVAIVQAFVFSLLTCMYIADAIEGGHLDNLIICYLARMEAWPRWLRHRFVESKIMGSRPIVSVVNYLFSFLYDLPVVF